MKKQFTFIFDGQPISKDNTRMRNKGGRYYLPKKYKDWEREKRFQAMWRMNEEYKDTIFPLEGDLEVSFYFFYKDKRFGDLGNAEKGISDAMNNFLWVDDKQISIIHKMRFIDKKNPRIEMVVKITP